jgi:hypothetical protein
MFKHHATFGMLVSAALAIPYAASEWRSLTDWLLTPNAGTSRAAVYDDSMRTNAMLQGNYQPSYQPQPQLQTQNNSSWFRTISDTNSTTVEETATDAIRAREELGREMIERARASAAPNAAPTPARTISNSNSSPSDTPVKEASAGSLGEFRADAPIPGPKFSDLGLVHLHEALTLEVTEQYVIQRWPRVNTGLIDKDLRGFRVPYLSGSNEDDPAGALTFYFNKKHQCEKLTFSGTVGDPRKMVYYLVQRYGFEPQPSPEAGTHLYQVRAGKQNSELTVKPATVVRSNTPHLRYQVELLISR